MNRRDSDTDWRMSAACATTDADLFMPEDRYQRARAIAICHNCDVIEQCAAWAATLPDPLGVIAGHFYGTKPKLAPARLLNDETEPRWYALWQTGLNDRELGAAVGASRQYVCTWRTLRGLGPNHHRAKWGKPTTSHPSPDTKAGAA